MKNQGEHYQQKNYQNNESLPSENGSNFKENFGADPSLQSNASSGLINKVFSRSQKTLLTFIYCISFWNFGICVAIFGPTLLDLACQTSR